MTRISNDIKHSYHYIPEYDINSDFPALPPSSVLIQDILRNGILQPVGLMRGPDKKLYDVVFGRRRILAARRAMIMAKEEEDREKLALIPAIIFEDLTEEEKHKWAMSENSTRSDNKLSDLAAIKYLLSQKYSIKDIASVCGRTTTQIKNVIEKYGSLEIEFIDALQDGLIAPGIGEKIAKESMSIRAKLIDILLATGTVRGTDISDAKEARVSDVLGSLTLPEMDLPNLESASFTVVVSRKDISAFAKLHNVRDYDLQDVVMAMEEIFQERYFGLAANEAMNLIASRERKAGIVV